MTYYYGPGSRRVRGQRVTLMDRIRMWRKRREKIRNGWEFMRD